MKFTVTWTSRAEADLAQLWNESKDQTAIARAADTIDRILQFNPQKKGDGNYDAIRTLVVDPLGVDFEVVEDDLLVYVLSVWDASAAE
jgi:hypothetical protein